MKNLAFHSLLRRKMIMLPTLTTLAYITDTRISSLTHGRLRFRLQIPVGRLPEPIEIFVALEDYTDDMNNICLRKDEPVAVLDKVSQPDLYHVVKLRPDGSRGNELWVPPKVLERRKSLPEAGVSPGKAPL